MRRACAAVLYVALSAILALPKIESAEARGLNRPREPTPLDQTVWTVKLLNGQPTAGRALRISFYSNGRVQIGVPCSYFLAGDFHFSSWGRLTTSFLDKPYSRLPCTESEARDERLIAEIMDRVRRARFSTDRTAITFTDSRGRKIEAVRR